MDSTTTLFFIYKCIIPKSHKTTRKDAFDCSSATLKSTKVQFWTLDVGREGFNGLLTLAPLLIKRVALWSAPFLSFGYLWQSFIKRCDKDGVKLNIMKTEDTPKISGARLGFEQDWLF